MGHVSEMNSEDEVMLGLPQLVGQDFAGVRERNPSSVTLTYGEPDDPFCLEDLTAKGRLRNIQAFGGACEV
jgi:hypothetical protein